MVSEVYICNAALRHLGANRIVSIDDNNEQARECKAEYAAMRDEVLAGSNWRFARKRAVLNQLPTAPLFEWQYQYQLPNDYLRVVRINEDYAETIPHEIEGDKLLCNEANVNLVYIYRLTETAKFTPQFAQAVSYRLAHQISMVLSENRTMKTDMFQLYKDAMLDAREADISEVAEYQQRSAAYVIERL